MGSDNYFIKRRDERQKRKVDSINQRPNNWLIVTEGTKTEPIYFEEVISIINKKLPSNLAINCKIVGTGMNTVSLYNATVDRIQYVVDEETKSMTIPYGKIFIVFDKDSFNDSQFNGAVKMCNDNGYIALWSNQAIEYWFLLHFNLYDCKLDRTNYEAKLNAEFKSKHLKTKYSKNSRQALKQIIIKGSLKAARRNAQKVHKDFTKHKFKPSDCESCTTNYKFFDEIDERNETLQTIKCDKIFN